jgi:microcystin-dependent protein
MKKTIIDYVKILGATALGFALPTMVQAADTPTLMSYQGNLLDANGDPVGKTAPVNKTVQFYVYDAEEDGNMIWGEEQTVTVDKGYFSVILGEGTKLTGENLFQDMEPGKTDANARYIGLSVDGVDITPRLRLLTTPYSQLSQHAVSAKNSGTAQSSAVADTLANNTDARSGFGFVPIGGIIMWNSKTIPGGWAICDGKSSTPDLRGRFVMSIGSTSGKHNDYSWTNNEALGKKAGSKYVKLLTRHMATHKHTIDNKTLGNHNHTGTTAYAGKHKHIQGSGNLNPSRYFPYGNAGFDWPSQYEIGNNQENNELIPYTSEAGNHRHTFTTSSNGSSVHNHSMGNAGSANGLENRPPFYAMYYIQRKQ